MAYTLKSSGHGDSNESKQIRREYRKPNDIVVKAYLQWKKRVGEILRFSSNLPENRSFYTGLEVCLDLDMEKLPPNDVNQICVLFDDVQNNPIARNSGFFLSALHTLLEEKIIKFNIYTDNKIYGLGYNLDKNKSLIVYPDVKTNSLGAKSNGTIVSFAESDFLGHQAKKGLVINKGKNNSLTDFSSCISINCGESLIIGSGAKDIVLAVKNPTKKLYRDARIVMDADECKELPFYNTLEKLVEAGPEDILTVIDELRPHLKTLW